MPQQLSLDLPPVPGRPFPEKGTKVVVYYKHLVQRWPGSPPEPYVATFAGTLDSVIPAGERPEKQMERGIMSFSCRASKYDRLVLSLKATKTGIPRYKVITMTKDHTWFLASEIGLQAR